eukprot:TRINITY_DN10317_c0_g1_i1.p1 TRINITY_DN10317_c0_g1~~TRINITY_DN10317_c0_g1_i1.p1  ORF type:complete len:74 (+),score=12.64 TRINITY_DN10317_c0_g1_i1:260-481(+)
MSAALLAAPKGQQMAQMDMDTPVIDDFSSSDDSEDDDGEPILVKSKAVSSASSTLAKKVMTLTDKSLWNTNFC